MRAIVAASWITLAAAFPAGAGAQETGLQTAFEAVCADTFPAFEAMDARLPPFGARPMDKNDRFSRVPFVIPKTAREWLTGKPTTKSPDDLSIHYAAGTVADRPAAGCEILGAGKIGETALAELLARFETATFVGETSRESVVSGIPARHWLVRLRGGGGILTIGDVPAWGKGPPYTSLSLVQVDGSVFDRLAAQAGGT